MSDFLSRLVMRDLGLADVVKPRPPSLFEPPSDPTALNGSTLEQPSEVGPTIGAPSSAPLASPPAPPLRAATPAARDVLTRETVVADAVDSSSRPARSSRVESTLETRSTVTVASASRTEAPRPQTLASPDAPAPALALRSGPATVRSTETPPPRPVVIRAEAANAERPSRTVTRVIEHLHVNGRSETAPAEPRKLSIEEPTVPAHVDATLPATIVVQPRVAPYAEPVSPLRPGGSTASEPTVHVTIGRVEVRATHPAPPPGRRERQASKATGLEEYLRRRAGARDR